MWVYMCIVYMWVYECRYVCVAISMCDGVYLDVGIAVHYRLDDIVEDIWYSIVFRLAVW